MLFCSIKRLSRSASEIRLRSGTTITLSDTNDVNDSNRGLVVTDAEGAARDVAWSDVDVVELR